VLKDLGEYTDEAALQTLFRDMDPDGNGIFLIDLMMIFTMFEACFLLICLVDLFKLQNAGDEVQSKQKTKDSSSCLLLPRIQGDIDADAKATTMKVPCEHVCLAQCVNAGRKNSGTLALFSCTSRRRWCDGAHNGGLGRSVVYAEHYRHSYLDVIRLAQQCRIFAICCNMAPAAVLQCYSIAISYHLDPSVPLSHTVRVRATTTNAHFFVPSCSCRRQATQ
jgi:hypothetical protein